jgi:hypothetical protein
MNFNDALGALVAELTPQPWSYTAADGTTLTIAPHGLPAAKDDAEVVFQISGLTEWLTTPKVQALVDAVTEGESWSGLVLGEGVEVLTAEGGLIVSVHGGEESVSVGLPASQRMPLVSAIRRALDVARGWEDDSR